MLKNTYYITFCTIVLLLPISCVHRVNEEMQRTEELRKIVLEYEYSPNADINYRYYLQNPDPQDEEVQIMNQMAYINFSKTKSFNEIAYYSDSLIRSPQFQNYTPIVQLYAHYFIAFNYNNMMNSEKSFDHTVRANAIVEQNPKLYTYEKKRLDMMLRYIYAKVSDNGTANIEYEKLRVSRANHPQNISGKLRAYYNISCLSSVNKDYPKSMEYANKGIQLIKDPSKNKFIIDLYGMKSAAYRGMNQQDSVYSIYEQVKNLYHTHKISKAQLYRYKVYYINQIEKFTPNEQQLVIYQDIFQYLTPNCQNRYLLVETSKSLSIHYNNMNRDALEREALLQELNYIDLCNELDQFFANEKLRVYQRLLEIDIHNQNGQAIQNWQEGIQSLDTLFANRKEFFVELSKYLFDREMMYTENNILFQKEEVQNSRNQRVLYLALFPILLMIITSIVILYIRNKRYEFKLNEDSNTLQIQNKTIVHQNEKTKKLIQALRQSNENLYNFAKVAAQDIKSPISSISNAMTYISKKYKSIIQKEDQEVFSYLNESTTNLNAMINVLLNYSSTTKNVVKNEKVEVQKVLHRILKNIATDIEKNEAQISIPSKIPNVKANETLIEQLFLNLISNAIKFKKPNESVHVQLGYRIVSPQKIEFSLADNGIGISKEIINDIFKVFKRFHTSEAYEGNGIGLAISKKIVEEFEGEIWVKSEPQEGSTFYFTLPLF